MTKKPGSFTISLDFELYWGMRDVVTLDAYQENLLGVWEAVPRMLELFQAYDIHATWATVGFLFHEDLEALKNSFPKALPAYENKALCPYVYVDTILSDIETSEHFKKMHFAKKLIDKIRQMPHQEVATHTYSHYYTREPVISPEAFEADLKKSVEVAAKDGVELCSLVFPRNQVDKESLFSALKKNGIKIYRGNPEHWAYREGETDKTFLQRVYRFFDIYMNLSGDHAALPTVDKDGLVEVKSSMFLRPYSRKFAMLEKLKLHKVKRAMETAAKKGENFHLWWHPHNFGVNLSKNMANLEELLQHYRALNEKYGMVSLNMQELGEGYV
ncbi:polysaccharide deacetylase family protein [Sulfurovum sp. NBC37-1]|uniref:polysaccharide deacetylase family protein n=1 Tax=Sulfurovum sp. (strain NBC37-1) TaxID=387093 RepID=UPI0001587B26|nr:polysaccharide deacetylase family protein [Sulfurovum sp. NBC37-1]BAF72477.1 conserved hypothetical protein [Sulfurovum sp. NBC37-1]